MKIKYQKSLASQSEAGRANIKMTEDITVAVVGSHSALDVCRGAKDEGFKTLVIAEKGRDKTYAKYYKIEGSPSTHSVRSGPMGCVDEVLYVDKFKDLLSPRVQKILLSKNCIFIPHRSSEVYINDYDAIEKRFKVPMFGNRRLLRFEERDQKPNQHDLLEKAGIKYPRIFKSPQEIDRLVIVKVLEKERGFERAFSLADRQKPSKLKPQNLVRVSKFPKAPLKKEVSGGFF